MPTVNDTFVPETLFAMRADGKWHVKYRRCRAAELPALLAAEGVHLSNVRILHEALVNPEAAGARVFDALHLGWVQHGPAGDWYPMDEPIPWLPGHPKPASVAFVLRSIQYGGIAFDVCTTSQTVGCFLDDIWDSLVMFVRFVQLIKNGGFPQAWLLYDPTTFFAVQAISGEPERVRLVIEQQADAGEQRLDVYLDRSALLNALLTFLNCIAFDDSFGHMFVCFCEMDGRYEVIGDKIDAEWDALVRAGMADPDDVDAECCYHGNRLAALYSLSPAQVSEVDEFRQMLRSLHIPDFLLQRPYRAF